jgi:Fe-S cluster assembly iron-binding protein IscA
MFEVTKKASDVIRDFLKNQKNSQAIRILVQAG